MPQDNNQTYLNRQIADTGNINPAPIHQDDSDEESLNLRDYFVKCLNNWKWFVLSILVCLAFAGFYLMKTPKEFTREAQVMIKDEEGGSSSSISASLSNMGLFQVSTNVANELLAFQSPALMADVIRELDLQTSYVYTKRLRPCALYGDSMIVRAEFPDFRPTQGVKFKLDLLGNGKAEVHHLIYNKKKYSDRVTVTLGDTVKVGPVRMVITPAVAYTPEFDYTIEVYHMPMSSAISLYQSRVVSELANDDASVINFTMTDVNTTRADNVLNTLIDIYNRKWVDEKEQIALASSRFINDRLAVIEKELGTVDSDIATYKGEHLVPDVAVASGMYMQDANENVKKQMEVSTQIAIIQYLIDYMQSPANKGALLPANSIIENQGINTQIAQYNETQLERTKLLTATGENSPLVKELDGNLASMKSALIASMRNQERALQTQLNSLIRSDRATNEKIASSPSQAKYLLSVERQQKVKEALYLFLLQKREENELSLAFTPYNTRVITPPMGSMTPTAPISRNILLIAFVIGLLLPAIIIFISENLNTRVRSREDLETMKAPLLGEIPEAYNKGSRVKRIQRRWREILGKNSVVEEAPHLYVKPHGRSVINESFRMLRANMEFVTRSRRPLVMMTTSFNPGSGKSFITLNLAAAVAVKRKDLKVLVIDLDLRRASVSRILPNHARGISDYLSEATDDIRPLIQHSECPGLDILPVGTIPPNPSELLYSERLQDVINQLKQEYDYIYLDCPPTDVVADATIITPLADVTLFIVRAGLLDRRLVPELDRMYLTDRYNSMLVVLNGTTQGNSPYRRYAYKNYYTSKTEK